MQSPANHRDQIVRILVVDDDPNQLQSLVIGLKLEGFDAVGTTDGNEALKLLAKKEFQVALFDLMMPTINGLQLARRIRDEFPKVVSILMSAYQLSMAQLAKVDVGVVGFIPKPCRFENIVAFINEKVERHGSGELLKVAAL